MKFEEEKGGTFIGIEVGVIVIAILQIAILSHFEESCLPQKLEKQRKQPYMRNVKFYKQI